VISQVGLDRIGKQLLLDLAAIGIVEPASKLRSIELLESHFGIKHRRHRAITNLLRNGFF